ncbi:MAG: GntR family transcriptional regulator [Micropruina sp.]|uniref:GntR family transcriptional regulator n=1 Tax=Micropruina sp. TaxID=2737536 RepID=UPI0039E3BD2A
MAHERSTPPIAADAVHEHLRNAILSAEYRPNHRLVEQELSTQLNVSRTPVREALLRLKQEGLVVQHKGWVVRDHAPHEIVELLEARVELEASAARLAAGRITPETLEELLDLMDRMEHTAARAEVNQLNDEFHALITQSAKNHVLADAARSTMINYWNFNAPIVFTEADISLVNEEHRALHAALAAGDGEAAAAIARTHVGRTADIITRALRLDPR